MAQEINNKLQLPVILKNLEYSVNSMSTFYHILHLFYGHVEKGIFTFLCLLTLISLFYLLIMIFLCKLCANDSHFTPKFISISKIIFHKHTGISLSSTYLQIHPTSYISYTQTHSTQNPCDSTTPIIITFNRSRKVIPRPEGW